MMNELIKRLLQISKRRKIVCKVMVTRASKKE